MFILSRQSCKKGYVMSILIGCDPFICIHGDIDMTPIENISSLRMLFL